MQKKMMYEMHKYWGKKPGDNIAEYINKYSSINDLILDPFSGYGVIACEALINNRNVIANDLNPISNFINSVLLTSEFKYSDLSNTWNIIRGEFAPFNNEWFSMGYNGRRVEILSVLRFKNDIPYKVKIKIEKNTYEKELTTKEIEELINKEKNVKIDDWYPKDNLIPNGRISAKEGDTIDLFFTKRQLSCISKLFALIKQYSSDLNTLNLLKLAFSANLANCSKLVPPIKSRGDMSPGAWMTGFYIGETYIENNVLHYFENRLKKVINGKIQFLEKIKNKKSSYYIYNNNTTLLKNIESSSVDYVLTDPPYGDTVPYFEQSILWNSWLNFSVDYKNEIVISNSKIRNKDIEAYSIDIYNAFKEINRVLKNNRFFSFTFHSLSGDVWKAIINACLLNNFEFIDLKWMTQVTFSPRQLNRKFSVKGDVVITLKKIEYNIKPIEISEIELEIALLNELKTNKGVFDTNFLYLKIIKFIFKEGYIINNLNVLEFLNKNFSLEGDMWIIK